MLTDVRRLGLNRIDEKMDSVFFLEILLTDFSGKLIDTLNDVTRCL